MDQMTTEKASDAGGANALLDEARNAAGKVVHTATTHLERRLDSEKNKAAEAIGGVADAIRSTAENDAVASGPAGSLGARAADGIEDVADYLQSRSLRDVIGEVEGLARREPAIFLGAAFVLGLVGGRFLKSSARSRADARHATSGVDQARTLMSRSAPRESGVAAGGDHSVRGGRSTADSSEERANHHEERSAQARSAPPSGHNESPRRASGSAASAAATSAASVSAGNAYKSAGTDGVTHAPASAAGPASAPPASVPPASAADIKKADMATTPLGGNDRSKPDGGAHPARAGGEGRS